MYIKTSLSKEPLMQCLEESVIMNSQGYQDELGSQEYNTNEIPETNKDPDIVEAILDKRPITCPCGCKKDTDTELISCVSCKRRQHSICYGILKPEKNKPFYCFDCIRVAPFIKPPNAIVFDKEEDQKDLCVLRRALVFCTSLKQVTVNLLEKHLGCSKQEARNTLARMEIEEFIRKSVGKYKYIVNDEMILTKGYQEYFPDYVNKENIELEKFSKIKLSNQKETQERGHKRTLKRKTFITLSDNDDEEDFQSQPKRKKCTSETKEVLYLDSQI